MYPMAKVQFEINGQKFTTVAAVSHNLPVDVLLGTNIPTFGNTNSRWMESSIKGVVMIVTICSRARREALQVETDYQEFDQLSCQMRQAVEKRSGMWAQQ